MRARKIALEEHVSVPDYIKRLETTVEFDGRPGAFFDGERAGLRQALMDIHGHLLAEMDAAGIAISILSLNAPGIQSIPVKAEAIDMARRANDYLAAEVAKNPRRFQGFAALPMQDPEAAAQELSRCVRELGFPGALINGYSQVDTPNSAVYLDQRQYWDFWHTVESLGVPVYLHPRDPLPGSMPILADQPWLMSSRWAFGVETATHALRLMTSGLFDRYPKLTIILGHLGETLPNAMWRIDHRIECMPARGMPARKRLDEYLRNNFYVTTSGNFCTTTLLNTVQWLGADRVLFSVDYPFEKISEAAAWFDELDVISEADWNKIARGNAEKLFKLAGAKAAAAAS